MRKGVGGGEEENEEGEWFDAGDSNLVLPSN
jgi:hypothetical protein